MAQGKTPKFIALGDAGKVPIPIAVDGEDAFMKVMDEVMQKAMQQAIQNQFVPPLAQVTGGFWTGVPAVEALSEEDQSSENRPIPEVKTFSWVAKGCGHYLPVLNSQTDPTEVFAHLPFINGRLRHYGEALLGKYKGEDVMPTPITKEDVLSDLSVAKYLVTRPKRPKDYITVSWSSRKRCYLTPEGNDIEEPLAFSASDHWLLGIVSGKLYYAGDCGLPAALQGIHMWGVHENGASRLPRTVEEMKACSAIAATTASIYYGAYLTDEAVAALSRKESVLERYREMCSKSPEIEVIDVMPVHIQVSGTNWGSQRRGVVLRELMAPGLNSAAEGSLVTYSGLGWQVHLSLNGEDLAGAVHCHEDGRFLISTWCQRELSKDGIAEAYGGGSMAHTLLTWALGPGFSRGASYGPRGSNGAALRRAVLVASPQPGASGDVGTEQALAVARFLTDEAKSLKYIERKRTSLDPEAGWPLISMNAEHNAADIIMPESPWFGAVWRLKSVSFPVPGLDTPVTATQLHATLNVRLTAGANQIVHGGMTYNTYLEDVEERKRLLELLKLPPLEDPKWEKRFSLGRKALNEGKKKGYW